MSRSHKRNVDGTLSQKSIGDRSCPRGRARCWVCSPGGHMHYVKPRLELERLELAEAAIERQEEDASP